MRDKLQLVGLVEDRELVEAIRIRVHLEKREYALIHSQDELVGAMLELLLKHWQLVHRHELVLAVHTVELDIAVVDLIH